MLRSNRRTAWLVVGVIGLAGLAGPVEAQQEARGHRPPPRPQPQPQPVPRPTPQPYRGPGYLARPSFAGIGRVKSNVDMLSNPARNMVVETPPVVVRPIPPRRDVDDRARWWYARNHDRRYRYPHPYLGDRYYGRQVMYYPYNDVISVGTGLTVGNGYGYSGYSYAPAYPTSTVGVMPLPAPAIRYDPTTGTYVYGYGNPYGAPLVTPMAPQPTNGAAPVEEAAPTEPPTALELAQMNLQAGMPEQAVNGLREHLKQEQDDARAQRLLGVALLRQKRFDDGVASIRQAYRIDPKLADEVMSASQLGLTDEGLRNLVLRTVTYAHRVDTGSAWLTVAALMQAEGRTDVAAQMLERAGEKGLETAVAEAMKAALTPSKD